MNVALPATRTFAYACGGSFACAFVMAVTGEAVFGREPHPWIRIPFLAVLFTLLLVAVYSLVALMVRAVVNGNIAFWTRMAAAARSRATADAVAGLTPPARRTGDVIILAIWALWTLGLAIAVPAMIIDQAS